MFDFAPRFARCFASLHAADGAMGGLPSAGAAGGSANSGNANQNPMNNLLDAPAVVDTQNDGFVDFYAMLDQPTDAPTIQLRSRLNEMYAEAQANRDHRNPQRRRQYATLLFWIPQARNVLLHEGKRAKYDAYAAQTKNGAQTVTFRAYLDELVGEIDSLNEGESILGLPDADAPLAPAARLSPRLDAVRAAAGEAVKIAASSAGATTVDAGSTPDITPFPASSPVNDSAPPADMTASAPMAAARMSSAPTPLPTTSASIKPAATKTPEVARKSSATKASAAPRVELNPVLQRERASLFSSAIGALTLFVVLLTARVVLPEMSLAVLCGIALVAGFVAWRVSRRRMLRGLDTKRRR